MLRVDKESGEWKAFLPYGFYTGFSDIIANLSVVDAMAEDGYVVSSGIFVLNSCGLGWVAMLTSVAQLGST